VLITTEPTQEQATEIWKGLRDFNRSRAGDIGYTPLLLELRDDTGNLSGGLIAKIYYGWLFVEVLWVAENARGTGLGARLLREAEEQARARGCRHAWLDSFSFQAPGFYLRQGYVQFGELAEYPPGHTRQFFTKAL
jgi:GNAT superfamily N-acetyltransferase